MQQLHATYYGKTDRLLDVRPGEHIALSPLTGNRVACKPSSISDHLLLHEHNDSSFNDFSILFCENNAFKLSLRESILIKRDPPELNRNISLYVNLYKAAYITQLMHNPQENVDNCFIFYNLYRIGVFYQYLFDGSLDETVHLYFLIQILQLLIFCMVGKV